MSSHLIHGLQTPKKSRASSQATSLGIGGPGECALLREVTLLLLLLIYVENPDRNRAMGDGTMPRLSNLNT